MFCIICAVDVTVVSVEITILVDDEKYLLENNFFMFKKLFMFIKVKGIEFSISFIYSTHSLYRTGGTVAEW